MLSLLDADKHTQHASITQCLRRCMGKLCRRMSRMPSVSIHQSLKLNEHEETPGALLEYDGDRRPDSGSDAKETSVETPPVLLRDGNKGV